MTPAMHLSAIKLSYADREDADRIFYHLERAFELGHEFGIDRAAHEVDQCNREGPYNAIGAVSRIRALKIEPIRPATVIEKDFL